MTLQEAIAENEKCATIKLKSHSTQQEMTIKRNGKWMVHKENIPDRIRTYNTTRVGNYSCIIEYRDAGMEG